MVTAADRAAATCLRWTPYRLEERSGEGFQRAIAKPFGASADAAPTPHVRGGSVSRRGLTQLHQGERPLSGGTNAEEWRTPNASRSSGGSAREELLSEKLPPSQYPRPPHFPRFFSFADLSASAAGMIFFVSVDDAACFFRLPPLRFFALAAAAFKSNSCCQFCCASSSCCA